MTDPDVDHVVKDGEPPSRPPPQPKPPTGPGREVDWS